MSANFRFPKSSALLFIALSLALCLPAERAFANADYAAARVQMAGDEGETLEGWLVSQSNESIALLLADGNVRRLDVEDTASLELKRGTRSQTAVGGLIGFLGGAVLGAALLQDEPGDHVEVSPLFGSLLFAPLGSLVGMLVGAGMRVDEWEEIPLGPKPTVETGLMLGDGVGVLVGVRF